MVCKRKMNKIMNNFEYVSNTFISILKYLDFQIGIHFNLTSKINNCIINVTS